MKKYLATFLKINKHLKSLHQIYCSFDEMVAGNS